ncbi:MAG: hypothetical protein PHH06_00450 [Candidatus Gracilibacteria bacterium]|nr:hypothetical protein [Candidatus Gracilibacteria bacterium]
MKKILSFVVFAVIMSLNFPFVSAVDKTNSIKDVVKEKNITTNTQISEKRARFKIDYKAKLNRSLQNKLKKISKDKLEVLIKRINALSIQIEASKYTQNKKDKLLGQLDALKELVEEAFRDEGVVL